MIRLMRILRRSKNSLNIESISNRRESFGTMNQPVLISLQWVGGVNYQAEYSETNMSNISSSTSTMKILISASKIRPFDENIFWTCRADICLNIIKHTIDVLHRKYSNLLWQIWCIYTPLLTHQNCGLNAERSPIGTVQFSIRTKSCVR